MLDQLRDLSSLPPAGLSKVSAERLSLVFKLIGGSAVLLAFLLFYFLPAAQPTVTKVSSQFLEGPYSCAMISKQTESVDLYFSNSSVPLAPDALPFSSLFVNYPKGVVGVAPVPAQPDTPFCSYCGAEVGCTATQANTAVFSINKVLYETYEACLADNAKVSCKLSDSFFSSGGASGNVLSTLDCSFGSQAIALKINFQLTAGNFYVASMAGGACDVTKYTLTGSSCPQVFSTSYCSNPAMFTSTNMASAVKRVFTPAAVCAPFAPNQNPPYLCTGTERQTM
jgi:hypothetical protein